MPTHASDILRTPAIHGTRRVERGANIIHGAKILQLGDINDDRPFTVDEASLQQMIELGNANPAGLKARFTHPTMSEDGLGKFLGRWKNFRREGDAVVADLHIADSSFTSPHGDIGSYVLDLADDDPEAFGVSAAGRLSREMLEEVNREDRPRDERVPMRWRKMMAADVVDEPAATRGGFFAVLSDRSLDLHATAVALLDQHLGSMEPPEILSRFRDFLKRWSQDRGKDFPDDDLAEDDLMTTATPPAKPESQPEPVRDHKRYVETFGDAGARWFLEGKTFEDCLLADRELQLAKLAEQDKRIEELGKEMAELKASIGEDPVSSTPPAGGGGKADRLPGGKKVPFLSCVNIHGRN